MRKNSFPKIIVIAATVAALVLLLCLVANAISAKVYRNRQRITEEKTARVVIEAPTAPIAAELSNVINSVVVETEEPEEEPEPTPTEELEPEPSFSAEEIDIMAKVLYGEADCVKSEAERAMVIWCILNRYDVKLFGDDTITAICTRFAQFAYRENAPVTERNLTLVLDVVSRWEREKAGEEHIGRTLPSECLYFIAASNPAKGEWHNTFYSYTNVVYGDKVWFGYENPLENPYQN